MSSHVRLVATGRWLPRPARLDTPCTHPSVTHLPQRSLRLGQPEGHVHSAIEGDGRGQGDAACSRWPVAAYSMPRPRVAVGPERAHAQFLSQGQGLLIVGFGLRDIGGAAWAWTTPAGAARALVPTCFLLPGQVERLACVLPGLLSGVPPDDTPR